MARARKGIVDETLLSAEDKANLRQRARDKVMKERKQRAEDAFLAAAVEEERHANDPEYEQKRITLNLAGHSDRIMLDGTVFFHGMTYNVPFPVYQSLKEVQARGWDHEDEVGGVNRDLYRKPRSPVTLRPGMENMAVTTSRLMGGI